MAAKLKTLVYVSRLSPSEKGELYKLDRAFPETKIGEALRNAIQDVVVDRLILATGCLQTARRLITPEASEEDLRAAVNRAYYAVHHAIRVLVLKETGCEADGHEQAIKELRRLLADADLRRRSGLSEDVIENIGEARDNRSVADYSPYDVSRKEDEIALFAISEGDWRKAAEFNIRVAQTMLEADYKVI
jgi:uncharacterized protein (UPF0332 family)